MFSIVSYRTPEARSADQLNIGTEACYPLILMT
jgi:hypothetical protein